MSKEVHNLEIFFKDPGATFKAGEPVTGAVLVEVQQELKVKSIKLYLLGVSRVAWDEKRAYTKGSAAKLRHKNLDSYLDETYMIMGRADTLQPGRYNWPFNFKLPLYLPSSFDGQWGRVYYAARVVFERPWKGDIEYTRPFSVIGLLDLNSDPDARKSIENVVEAPVGRACCKSGPVMAHLALAHRGFAVGQDIKFRARIENESRKKLNVRVVLSQQACYRADKQVRKTNTIIKVMTKGDVAAGESVIWEDELKAIPTVPPTRLGGGCRTIDVKYLFTLIMVPSGPGAPVEVPVEVIIGSVALHSSERRASSFSASAGSQHEMESARAVAQQLFVQKTTELK